MNFLEVKIKIAEDKIIRALILAEEIKCIAETEDPYQCIIVYKGDERELVAQSYSVVVENLTKLLQM